jgi:TatA/E family protein of Tat protein translocase
VFGVSLPELIVVFVVILLVFGPDKLPEMAKRVGRWTGEFRRTSDSLRREFYHTVYNPAVSAKQELRSLGHNFLTEEPSNPEPSEPKKSKVSESDDRPPPRDAPREEKS